MDELRLIMRIATEHDPVGIPFDRPYKNLRQLFDVINEFIASPKTIETNPKTFHVAIKSPMKIDYSASICPDMGPLDLERTIACGFMDELDQHLVDALDVLQLWYADAGSVALHAKSTIADYQRLTGGPDPTVSASRRSLSKASRRRSRRGH